MRVKESKEKNKNETNGNEKANAKVRRSLPRKEDKMINFFYPYRVQFAMFRREIQK